LIDSRLLDRNFRFFVERTFNALPHLTRCEHRMVAKPRFHPAMTEDTIETPDVELIRQIGKGDTAAFATFYDRHSTLLFSIAIHVLGDRQEAEDALQDAAAIIWERAPLYEPSLGKPSSWAVVITRNKAIDRLRALHRRSEGIARIKTAADSGGGEQVLAVWHLAIGKENAAAVRVALAELPAGQRHAIELAFFTGLSQSEIATHLGEPLGTIKARIRRGMNTLRDALEETL
jgi:RNA polymerase sigma-70 factor (ECF subfamily)